MQVAVRRQVVRLDRQLRGQGLVPDFQDLDAEVAGQRADAALIEGF